MRTLRIAVCQSNFMVGNIPGNLEKIKEGIERAHDSGADVLLFPELTITGYPPEDLVFKPEFIKSNMEALKEAAGYTVGLDMLVVIGFIDRQDDIYNSAALVHNGEIKDVYHKIYLPNYGVFDEKRYFASGTSIPVYTYKGIKLGVNICEDLWYPDGPAHYQVICGDVEVILNNSASPYHTGKQEYREKMYSARAGDETVWLVNCNMVGGQDELVFDGASSAYSPEGKLVSRLSSFEQDFSTFDIDADTVFRMRLKDVRRRGERHSRQCPFQIRQIDIASEHRQTHKTFAVPTIQPLPSVMESIYKALVLGTHDYLNKNGFKEAIIAISGGIDSALVAAIAVDALGADRVKGIYLPSEFSAGISGEDAHKLGENLGIEMFELPINPIFGHFRETLSPIFKDRPFDVAEENLQSRIRGNIVMALSNKFGWLVLTTGNKSEMSTGYATLYGDMAGGFAVIKDVLKTIVFELCEYINRDKEIIPRRIIDRPPSAELRPDQKDTDSLPPYEILDAIIRGYVEEDKTIDEITREVGDEAIVRRFVRLIDRVEYKRRQAPPGIKITPRAFGRDRRMPITNGYRMSGK